MFKYKVIICVSAYNHENYIEECLLSIVSQKTNFKFKIIIGDDCSKDNTKKIIENICLLYPNIIEPVFHLKNIGSAQNYNYLHKMADAEYICHCDGDDLFFQNKLQKQVDYLDKNPECSVVWHKVKVFDERGRIGYEYNHKDDCIEGQKITLPYLLRVGTVATHSSIMYRKSARITYQSDFVALDLFYSIEFLRYGYGIVLNNILGGYRINSGSYSNSEKSALLMRELCISHYNYYLRVLPNYKSQIFIYACINFLIDFKNRRKTAFGFLKLMIKSFGYFKLNELIDSFKSTFYLRLPKLADQDRLSCR